jgi:hypothetical protein
LFVGVSKAAPAETIAGQVVDAFSGDPIGFAQLKISISGSIIDLVDLEAGADGRFVQQLDPATYVVRVSHSKYQSAKAILSVPLKADRRLTFRMVPYGSIKGRVLDDAGEAVAGVPVLAFPVHSESEDSTAFDPTVAAHGRTGDSGEYGIQQLTAGRYYVAAGMKGSALSFYGSARPQIVSVAAGEEDSDIDIVEAPCERHTVSGAVESDSHSNLFTVLITTADNPGFVLASTQTDSDGTFHFNSLPSGTYNALAFNKRLRKVD